MVFLRRVSKGPVHLQTQTRNEQMEFAGAGGGGAINLGVKYRKAIRKKGDRSVVEIYHDYKWMPTAGVSVWKG